MAIADHFCSLSVCPVGTLSLDPNDFVDVVGFVEVHGRLRQTVLVTFRADALVRQLGDVAAPSFVVHDVERPSSQHGLVHVFRDGHKVAAVPSQLFVVGAAVLERAA